MIARCGQRPVDAEPGFTTIELVIVVLLVAILAAYALPRLNSTGLQVTPVAERVAAEIRHARNLAMTRAEPHTFSVDGGVFTIGNDAGTVPLSDGRLAGSLEGLAADAVSLTFSARFGQPDAGAAIQLSGGGSSRTVMVAGGTGYVRVE